jgi:hypothetical protein
VKRLLAGAALFFAVTAPARADIQGAWTGVADPEDGQIHIQLTQRAWNMYGEKIRIDDLQGLPPASVRAAQQTAVSFRLVREAGSFTFDGTFREGLGGGQYRFTPSASYAAAIRAMGLDFELQAGRSETDLLMTATLVDLSTAYIRSMRELFPDLTFREAKRARAAGVTPEYVEAMRGEGISIDSIRDATRLAVHGIDRQYVRQMSKYKR